MLFSTAWQLSWWIFVDNLTFIQHIVGLTLIQRRTFATLHRPFKNKSESFSSDFDNINILEIDEPFGIISNYNSDKIFFSEGKKNQQKALSLSSIWGNMELLDYGLTTKKIDSLESKIIFFLSIFNQRNKILFLN